MSVVLSVAGGATATVAETDGVHVVLQATISSPPGSTLSMTLDGDARVIRVKVRGCKKLPDELGFRIEGRLVDLTKEQRTRLMERRDPR